MLDNKKYVEFPEEMKESLTENFEVELDKAEDEEVENEEKDIFDFEDKSVDEIAFYFGRKPSAILVRMKKLGI